MGLGVCGTYMGLIVYGLCMGLTLIVFSEVNTLLSWKFPTDFLCNIKWTFYWPGVYSILRTWNTVKVLRV